MLKDRELLLAFSHVVFSPKEGGLTLLVPIDESMIRSYPTTSFRPVLALSYKTK